MKKIINTLFISIFFLTLAIGQNIEQEKTYTHTINTAGLSRVEITHQRGPLYLEKSTDGQIHVDMLVRITGKHQEDINLLFESIDIEEEKSGDRLTINSSSQISSWIQTLGKTRVTLKSGAIAYDIKDLEMSMTIKMPDIKTVALKNKYEKIEVAYELSSNLEVDLYSGEFYSKNLGGNLMINSKYSTLSFGNFQNGTMDFYECKASGGQGNQLDIHSKYSTIKLADCQQLTLNSYEDKYTLQNINGNVNIQDKYSHFRLGKIGDGRLDLYETEFELNSGQTILLQSKYGSFRSESLTTLELPESYETDFTIGKLGNLVAKNDKYGSFDIDELSSRFIIQGYESSVDVSQVSAGLAEINIDTKYDRMRFGIPSGLKYSLDVEMKYGNVSFSDGIFERIDRQEKGDHLNIKAGLGDDNRKAKIIIRSYETDVVLK